MSGQETNADFLKSIQDLISKASRIHNFEKRADIRFEYIIIAAKYLDVAKPQSHMRPHKRRLLILLEKLIMTIDQQKQSNAKPADLISIQIIKKEYWYPVCYFLNNKEGFMVGYSNAFLNAIIGIAMDLFLFSTIPFYKDFKIPAFTIILSTIAIIRVHKHKVERKFLK